MFCVVAAVGQKVETNYITMIAVCFLWFCNKIIYLFKYEAFRDFVQSCSVTVIA